MCAWGCNEQVFAKGAKSFFTTLPQTNYIINTFIITNKEIAKEIDEENVRLGGFRNRTLRTDMCWKQFWLLEQRNFLSDSSKIRLLKQNWIKSTKLSSSICTVVLFSNNKCLYLCTSTSIENSKAKQNQNSTLNEAKSIYHSHCLKTFFYQNRYHNILILHKIGT